MSAARREPRILVTGFGGFPGMPENPTETLVETLRRRPPPGVTAQRLDTRWDVVERLPALAARYDAVILFGVAGGARAIRYERIATPHAASRIDAAERMPGGLWRTHLTRIDVPRFAAAARRAGFPVAVSHSAGTYVCNASYNAALSANPHALFVHVPPTTARGPLSAKGLEAHARWLIATLRLAMAPSPPRRVVRPRPPASVAA